MLDLRVFISSPGDAAVERRRAERVISRLNGEAAGLARLTTVRWETEFYKAHETFQTQIPPATDCEIVVGILKWRLGTELPPGFARHPDGEPYPSGTAYELLTAIDKRRAGGELPDVFVFRYTGGAPNPRLDDPRRDAVERDWASLRGFFERWFVTRQGHFIAALNSYDNEDDFEAQLETMLHKWLAERIAGGRLATWPATKGSPFRGLSVFGAKHAPVFFGRAGDIRRAMDLWRDYAARGQRSLLMVGASGSGKSSLARAGLIPRLVTPGVVPEVDVWRIAVMRPGDSVDGPFAVLAAALLRGEAELPAEEEGRGAALPEIAEGDSKTPAELAAVLGHPGSAAVRPIVNALDRIAARAKDSEHFGRAVRCDLVLLVDQLDELFAPSVPADVRERFAQLLTALVACGRVWLLASLRADLYAAMLEVPTLKALKDAGASYDLAPPGAAELAEIVRAPAAAAGLVYEADPATGERLDERLLREADRPDMLPLVQLVLARLYEARETRGGETVLPYAAFAKLGGVKGIVAEAGEGALAKLGATEQARLAPLIRRLAERAHGGSAIGTSTGGTLTIRAAPLAEAAPDAPSRALVDALVAARLLTLSGEGDGATQGAPGSTQGAASTNVRLAHQRVLTDWDRAKKIVADSADFYRVRDEVEGQRLRWESGRRRGELLLARGLPLAEARAMAARYGPELSPATHAYIAASRRRATRSQTFGYVAAVVFVFLAIGASLAADQRRQAEAQKVIAQKSFAAAKSTVDSLVFNIAQGLRNAAGMRVETIRAVLDIARKTVDDLLATAPDDRALLRSKMAMLNNFAATYLAAGDLKDALPAAEESLVIARRLATSDPASTQVRRDLAVSLNKVGDAKMRGGDQAGALAAYQESLAIAQKLASENPRDEQAQRDVSVSLEAVGDVKLQAGDQAGELAAYQDELAIHRKLVALHPDGAQARRDVSVSLFKVGNVKLQAGDQAGALAADQESLAIARKLAAENSGNTQSQRDLAVSLATVSDVERQAGDSAGALALYEESLDIRRKLAALDPGNALAQRDVGTSLDKIGDVKLRAGDQASALAAYREEVDIDRKLAVQDPGNVDAERDLSVGVEKLGDIESQAGDKTAALAAYGEDLSIARKLATLQPGSARAQSDVAISLGKVGNAKAQGGDSKAALAAFDEALAIRRKVAAQSPANAAAQRDVFLSLEDIGDAKRNGGDGAGALAAYNEALEITRKLAALDSGNAQAQRDVTVSLDRIGDIKRQTGDAAGGLAAYREGLAISRKLAALDPASAQAQRDVAVDLDAIGNASSSAGDSSGALAAFEEELDTDRKLAAKDSGNAQAQRDVVVALDRVGGAKTQAGDRAGAIADLQEALGIARTLVAQNPKGVQALSDLSTSFTLLGDTSLQAGDKDKALSNYQDGKTAARALVALDPSDSVAKRNLSISLNKVGEVQLQRGDLAAAIAAFQESTTLARALATQDPGNEQAKNDLTFSLNKLGTADQQKGDLKGAEAAYQEMLAIARAHAASRPNDTQAQRDVSVMLNKVGDVELAQGDKGAAVAAYLDGLEIARRIHAAAPDGAQARADVYYGLARTAGAKQQMGDKAGAAAAAQEGLDIARDVARRSPSDVEAQWDLALKLAGLAAVSDDPMPLYSEALGICKTLDAAGKLAPARRVAIAFLEGKLAAKPAPAR